MGRCPARLGLTGFGRLDGEMVSDGQFLAICEYEKTTGFFPAKQTITLLEERDYVECDDLHSILDPQTSVDYLKNAFFVWSMTCQRL